MAVVNFVTEFNQLSLTASLAAMMDGVGARDDSSDQKSRGKEALSAS
jgi:hypothetical protein